ncbi:MAG: Na/Pi cotransporter family protein [Candidatus Fermentibacteraceae bacterium]|nr:Na/Pi cotransporter family protein [Candidatus Fermentibacteraceae bacterium]MBN2609141.1 Na/Pi cotransporter family protein [Candidatus Fermentibacteraceae bacterium]
MRTALLTLLFIIATVLAGDFTVEEYGNSQTGKIETVLKDQLQVRVLDSVGRPLEGVSVIFETYSDGGVIAYPFTGREPLIIEGDTLSGDLSAVRILTDQDGFAGISLKLGDKTSNNSVDARIVLPDGSEERIHFSALAVDLRSIIFQLIGGLAIFLLGMKMMSESLQTVAGNKLRTILKKITSNRFLALTAGALMTAAIQSSSATSVIAVSFVNSGLMALQQAVGVIIGANIGTTVTGQLIAFKITTYAFPIVAVGFAMFAFARTRRNQFWGRAIVGLGLIFLGMTLMKDILGPLKSSMAVKTFFTDFSTNPFLAVFAGTVLTCIIQSSSATVGLTMTLAGAGLISLQGAFYLVLGDNIGTTITAQLSAIGASRTARQTAMAHTLFNVIGAVYMGLLISDDNGFVMNLVRSTAGDPLRQVANAHSMFNILNALVFLPLVPLLARLCRFIIPDRAEVSTGEVELVLDEHLLDSPALAIDNLEREMVKMAAYAEETVKGAISCFFQGFPKQGTIMSMEDRVDYMQRDLTIYASKLFQRDLDQDQSLKLPVLIHTINDLERISDHAVNIVEARGRVSGILDLEQSELGSSAVKASDMVEKMLESTRISLESHDRESSEAVLALEARLNSLEEDAREEYTECLTRRGKDGLQRLALLDFTDYCERIGDHLTNIAQSLLGGGVWHGTDDLT